MSLSYQHLFSINRGKKSRHRNRKNYNQYFTPEFAVEKAFSFIQKEKIKNIIDPAVGNGIFLKIALEKWNEADLFGIDIDKKIIRILRHTNLPRSNFFCANSLLKKSWELPYIQRILSRGGFDVIAGNPPFSSWFNRIKTKGILSNYQLAHKNGKLSKSLGIEILFLELFINLAKKDRFIVIVLPDGVVSNPQNRYIREFILKKTTVLKIINLPRNVFEDTSAKTSILILQKINTKKLKYSAQILNLNKTGMINNTIEVKAKDLLNRMDYYYYFNLKNSSLNKLIGNGVLFKPLSNFVVYRKTGKTIYGKERRFTKKGLRFLHATNITPIGINYKKDERFIAPSSKMNMPGAYAKIGDILFVRVGVGCAGRIAIVDTKENEGVATDYIHIFRVKDINPYFLVIYLKTKFGRDSINLLKHGVTTVSINKTDLLSLPIPLVPKAIQLEIEEKYKNILTKYRKNLNNRLLVKVELLINYLEHKLMNLKRINQCLKRA